jgi:hypothetical protein
MTEPPDIWTAESVSICITVYHEHIRAWAEQVGVRPSAPNENDRDYPFVFTSGALVPGYAEMTWSDFFLAFERANVALTYSTPGRNLQPDGSYQFVSQAAVPELVESTIVEPAI